jgi:hypothetical protein
MKKQKIAQYGIILWAALFAWGITACSGGDDSTQLNTGALLTSLKIAGDPVTLPSPMSSAKWSGYADFGGLEPEFTGSVMLPNSDYLENLEIIATGSTGAILNYARATGTAKGAGFAADKPTSMTNGQYLYIRVVSEDGQTTNYYRIQINAPSNVATLSGVRVASTNAVLGTPSATWDGVTTGSVGLSTASAASAVVDITKGADRQTVSSAYVPKANIEAEPAWTLMTTNATALPADVADGDLLCFKVVSETEEATLIYKIEIQLGRNANLSAITVAGTNVTARGTPAATWAGVTAGNVTVLTANKNSVAITVTGEVTGQTISFAYVTKANADTEPSVWNDIGSTNATTVPIVADGDFLCFKVVAENGTTTQYYQIEVWMGRTAALTSVKIGSATTITNSTGWGTPTATWNVTNQGNFLGREKVPAGGLAVVVVAADGATVQYAYLEDGTADPTSSFVDVPASLMIQFKDEGYLYLKVLSGNGQTTQFYKIHASMLRFATINFGIPAVGSNVIDPIWASVAESYDIKRVFPTDSNAAFIANPDTYRVAKALWDYDGLYVFWDITDPSNGAGSGEHLADSIELFINEAYLSSTGAPVTGDNYDTGGSQYRVGRNGAISGYPSAAVSALNTRNKFNAWEKDDNTGYYVVMQAPWRFKSGANKAFMFDAEGKVKDNIDFSFELQINACASAGARQGVLCWNNSATGNYRNTSNFGIATLSAEGRVKKAETPTITVHPKDANYYVTQTEPVANLSVTVTLPASGTLSYQWWSASTAADTGAAIASNATGSTYTPSIADAGDTWYWVVVTNTDTTADTGYQTASVNSNRALVGVDADETAFNAEYFSDFGGVPKRNVNAISTEYTSAVVIDTPRLFINKYTKYTFVVKIYEADGTTEITPIGYGVVQLKMRGADNVQIGGDIHNIGAESGTSTANIPQAILDAGGVAKLDFETSSNWVASEARFIEIISIKFHH